MKKDKIRVGVVMGGPSAEREISLITGSAVCNNLDKSKYSVMPIEYGKDYKFYSKDHKKRRLLELYELKKRTDIVFIALHGTHGEDGGVQGLCETLNIKYTGSNVLSSALCMNKVFSGQIYNQNNLPHPFFIDIKKDGWKKYKQEVLSNIREKIKYPAVIKPVDQGSAVGVSIVKNQNDLIGKLDTTFKSFPWLMVQRYIMGCEATCGILEKNNKLIALPPTAIIPNAGEFYDYKSKYAKGGSTHICPANFSDIINKKLQEYAGIAHKQLRCRGMSRTDFFVTKTNQIWLVETNTIPGMTPTSLLPEAALKIGIKFSTMLDMIIIAGL
ncbi:MAG: D-alanine--D-alanine ligase [bacterium]